MDCDVGDCGDDAAFELHVPWDDNRFVCAGHARVMARRDGVVADPLTTADESLPRGATKDDDP